jgi:hypothetical protein
MVGESVSPKPNFDDLNHQVSEIFKKNTFLLISELLKSISNAYNLSLEELNQKYLTYFSNLSEISELAGFTENVNKSLPINQDKCMARTACQSQCSRKKQPGKDFCGSHKHNQPHGRYDQPETQPVETKPKKRGRPPKKSVKQKTELTVEINAETEIINGIEYLVDTQGRIFELPDGLGEQGQLEVDQLKLVGKKTSDNQIVWYSESDLMFIG